MTISEFKQQASLLNPSSSPDFVQTLISTLTDFLVEVLSQRGLTLEEHRARRQAISDAEKSFIDAEIQRLQG